MDDHEVVYRLAVEFYDRLEWGQSLECALRVLDTKSDHLPALELVGSISTELGDHRSAVNAFEKCIWLDPSKFDNYLALAQLCNPPEALSHYKTALKLVSAKTPSSENNRLLASIHCSIADVLITEQDLSDPKIEMECKRCLKEALTLDPDNCEMHYHYALMFWCLKDPTLCLKHVDKYLDLLSMDQSEIAGDQCLELAKMAMDLRAWDHAICLLEELDESVETCYFLGVCHQNLENWDDCVKALSRARTLAEDQSDKEHIDHLLEMSVRALHPRD